MVYPLSKKEDKEMDRQETTQDIIKRVNKVQAIDFRDLAKYKVALDEASNSDVPYMMNEIDQNGHTQIRIDGNANKTEVKKQDYTLIFWIPEDRIVELFGGIPENARHIQNNGCYALTLKMQDKYITPRAAGKIGEYVMKVIPYFRKIVDIEETAKDGTIVSKPVVKSLTEEEAISFVNSASSDLLDAMYNMVFAYLEIDEQLKPYATDISVYLAAIHMSTQHPEIFNEQDFL